MTWKEILKTQRPDYPDLDGDGDTEEPMVDALETVEQVESVKKVDLLSVECPTCEAPKGKPCMKFPKKKQDPDMPFRGKFDYDAGRTIPMAGVHKARRFAIKW